MINPILIFQFCKVYLQHVIIHKKRAFNVINTTLIFSDFVRFFSSKVYLKFVIFHKK